LTKEDRKAIADPVDEEVLTYKVPSASHIVNVADIRVPTLSGSVNVASPPALVVTVARPLDCTTKLSTFLMFVLVLVVYGRSLSNVLFALTVYLFP
jgi:hypothetical protein